MNFKKVGSRDEGYAILKSVDKKVTSKGSTYLDMIIADKNSEMSAKLWDYVESKHNFEAGDFVKIRGTSTTYQDQPQFKVEDIRKVLPEDDVNVADFVPSACMGSEIMYDNIIRVVSKFKDEDLRNLVNFILNKNEAQLMIHPAAKTLHHAVRGGLLMHTLSMLRVAEGIAEVYPFVNKDLLFTGIILHDIAKLQEIGSTNLGIATDYTVDGNLLGHLVMGAMYVDKVGTSLGIPHDKLVLIEHMLISHHGQPEFGAAKYPVTLEATILSLIDVLDARIYEINDCLKDVEKGEFSPKQWALNNMPIYKHPYSQEGVPNLFEMGLGDDYIVEDDYIYDEGEQILEDDGFYE